MKIRCVSSTPENIFTTEKKRITVRHWVLLHLIYMYTGGITATIHLQNFMAQRFNEFGDLTSAHKNFPHSSERILKW